AGRRATGCARSPPHCGTTSSAIIRIRLLVEPPGLLRPPRPEEVKISPAVLGKVPGRPDWPDLSGRRGDRAPRQAGSLDCGGRARRSPVLVCCHRPLVRPVGSPSDNPSGSGGRQVRLCRGERRCGGDVGEGVPAGAGCACLLLFPGVAAGAGPGRSGPGLRRLVYSWVVTALTSV